MVLEDYIKKQFREHTIYVKRFKKAELSFSNEQITPKGKRVSWIEAEHLITKDLDERVKKIIQKSKSVWFAG